MAGYQMGRPAVRFSSASETLSHLGVSRGKALATRKPHAELGLSWMGSPSPGTGGAPIARVVLTIMILINQAAQARVPQGAPLPPVGGAVAI